MRVLYCVGWLGHGGLERFVSRVALRAHRGGEFHPVVCCLREKAGLFVAALEAAGVEVFAAPAGWARDLRAWSALRRAVRAAAPDVVHSQVNFSLLQQFSAVRAAGRAAFCVTERNCYPLEGSSRRRRILQFHLLRRLGMRYSANSRAVAAHLARMVGVAERSLPVLPNGVPALPFDAAARARLRAQLGWQPGQIGILYVARMDPHKGHVPFLQALAGLRRRSLPVKAVLVSDGPQRAWLEALVERLELSATVIFAGVVPNVEDYLQAADLVALCSSHEGMPNSVLEAMAAGKAIVATPAGAVPELLDGGRAGIVLPGAEAADVEEALVRFATDGALRDRMGRRARERARRFFSLDAAVERLWRYYCEVI